MTSRGREGDGSTAAARPAEAVCRVSGLSKSYRAGFWGRRQAAIHDISFAVGRGEICGLLGHNGAGKTTTLKSILDLVRPDTGTIELFGASHRDRRARRAVGYLPESPYFYDHLTALELLDFYGRLGDLPGRERAARAHAVLGQVGMAAFGDWPLRKFSKGMLQRIGLAQALLTDPDLLILDEPMSGLDPLGRREVRELLGELRTRGKTILLSSHIVPDLEALADSVVILARGRVAGRHDLRADQATRFEVEVGGRPRGREAAALWQRTEARAAGGGRHGEILAIPDLPSLRLLLELCAREGVAVRSVVSRQTGLEELFLRSVGGAGGEAAGAAGEAGSAAAADRTAWPTATAAPRATAAAAPAGLVPETETAALLRAVRETAAGEKEERLQPAGAAVEEVRR